MAQKFHCARHQNMQEGSVNCMSGRVASSLVPHSRFQPIRPRAIKIAPIVSEIRRDPNNRNASKPPFSKEHWHIHSNLKSFSRLVTAVRKPKPSAAEAFKINSRNWEQILDEIDGTLFFSSAMRNNKREKTNRLNKRIVFVL